MGDKAFQKLLYHWMLFVVVKDSYYYCRISGVAAAAVNNNDLDGDDDLGQAGAAALTLGHHHDPRLGGPRGCGTIGSDGLGAKKKRVYDLRLLFGKIKVKVGFDRLALLALLDRSVSLAEASASVILAVGVAVMTGLVNDKKIKIGQ